ncbi:MAG: hypothetical protein R2831_00680 [Chitinophagaceae bacterium]
MKKQILSILLCIAIQQVASAQNEGRFSFYTGISKTTLSNPDDVSYGDLLPTFKPTYGVSGEYHFTVFKRLPLGLSFNFEQAKMGQNYYGEYQDSTKYYAYSRLNYTRLGMQFHFGTNPRRQVALVGSFGANLAFLNKYQDRYELIRYNNDRLIMDIKNSSVTLYDTANLKGTLKNPLYNNFDLQLVGTLGLDFLISKKVVFGFFGRLDYGMNPVETNKESDINLETEPASVFEYKPAYLSVKYRGPYSDTKVRKETKNNAIGFYLTVKYRLFNPEKIEFYYREKTF